MYVELCVCLIKIRIKWDSQHKRFLRAESTVSIAHLFDVQVSITGAEYTLYHVNLEKRTWGCTYWQSIGIACKHAVVIWERYQSQLEAMVKKYLRCSTMRLDGHDATFVGQLRTWDLIVITTWVGSNGLTPIMVHFKEPFDEAFDALMTLRASIGRF